MDAPDMTDPRERPRRGGYDPDRAGDRRPQAGPSDVRNMTDPEAERSVLGGVLLHGLEALEVLPEADADDFYDRRHASVFTAARELQRKAHPVDHVTIEAELRRMGKLDDVGGVTFLAELAYSVPSIDRIEHHWRMIRTARVSRESVAALLAVVQDVRDGQLSGEEIHHVTFSTLSRIEVGGKDRGKPMGEIAVAEWHRMNRDMEARAAGQQVSVGVPTGLSFLDHKVGGLPVGVPNILMARPALGKTSYVIAVAEGDYEYGNDIPLIYSNEDQWAGFAMRRLARSSGAAIERIRAANVTQDEWNAMNARISDIARRPEMVILCAGWTVEEIVADVRRRRRRAKAHGTPDGRTVGRLVILDYIQLVPYDHRIFRSTDEGIGHVSKALSQLAQEENIAVMICSQMNRDVERRQSPLPALADLRGSGSLEQDGKLIQAIHYPYNYDHNADEFRKEMHVLKNTLGQTGKYPLFWDPPTATFCDSAMDLARIRGLTSHRHDYGERQ
jgi:replicative DNA helicase